MTLKYSKIIMAAIHAIVYPSTAFLSFGKNIVYIIFKDGILYLVYKGTGNELTLIFDYLKEGATDREQLSQTLFLSVKKEKEQTSGGSQTNTAEYKPNFRIVGKISSKQEGKNVSVEFPIKNVSNFTAKDIQITMSADSADSPFSAPMGHLSVSVDEIKPDAEKKIKLDLAVKPNTKSGIYPLKLEFKYGNLYGDSFSSSEVIYMLTLKTMIKAQASF